MYGLYYSYALLTIRQIQEKHKSEKNIINKDK